MDYSPVLFVTCLGLNFACLAYIASQCIKGLMGLYKFLNDKDEKELSTCCMCKCVKGGLQINHCESVEVE